MFPHTLGAPLFWVNVATTIFNGMPWVSFFLILQLFGVRLYSVRERETCKRIQKRIKFSSHTAEDGKGYGYALGFWYICNVSISEDSYSVWLVATAASYEMLTREIQTKSQIKIQNQNQNQNQNHQDPSTDMSFKIYERAGSFHNCWFKHRSFSTQQTPQKEQASIIEQIKTSYMAQGHTVVFLHGPPGTGKSMIGVLLASAMGGSYCNTLRPWQPGDMLGSLYSEVEPSKEKPLILSFDEVDVALVAITAGIPDHKHLPIATPNKTGWNRLMDEIGRGMFPHLILLMTSNRDPTFVNGLDESYFREGRVDLIVAVNEKIERKKVHAD